METIKFKKELTVENIINVLSKQDTSIINKFYIEKWHLLIDNLLNEFFETRTKNHSKRPYGVVTKSNGFNKFNEKYKDVWIDSLNRITFRFLYSNIIVKLLDDNKIKFNVEELGIIYKFLVLNYDKVKNLTEIDNQKLLWRCIMNAMFGASKYFKSSYYYFQFLDDNIIYNNKNEVDDLVTHYTETIFNKIFYKYNDKILMISTDVIYYNDDIDNEFYDELNKLGIKYDVENNLEGIFQYKCRYLIQDNFNKKIIVDTIHRKNN